MLLKRAFRFSLVLLAALSLYALRVGNASAVITFQSAGAVSYSGIVVATPAYPAAVAAGDLLILLVGMKPSGAINGSVPTPEGWTLIATASGGGYGGVPAADTGDTHVFAFSRIADGTETGTLDVRLVNSNVTWTQIYRLTNATMDWSVAGATGSDNSGTAPNNNVSITMSSNPGVISGDFILGAMVIPTDVTVAGAQFSAESFSQTSATFSAAVEILEPRSGTGNDISGFVARSSVTVGTGTGNPTLTATAASASPNNVRGPGVFIRVRATGAITYQAPGAISYWAATAVATKVCAAHPASVASGDLLVTIIGMKPSVANSGSVTTPSGWTAVSGGSLTGAGGYGGTLGVDTGNTNVFSYYRVATGIESGERCFTLANNNISWAEMYRYSSTTGTWLIAGTTGSDANGTAPNDDVSITMSGNPGVTVGDHILGAMVIPTDVTNGAQFTAESFSQTGATFSAAVEISEPFSATGNDIGGFVARASVTAGVGTAIPTLTAAAASASPNNVRGPGVFIRIRDETAQTQAAFRFYEDGTEAGSTAIGAQDTNISRDLTGGNSNLQLRLRVQEINGLSGAATDDYQLQYSKNAGAYANVTGASANVRGFNSGSLTDGGATTNRLTAGTGSFVAGEISQDGLVDDHQITASNYTEHLYSLTLMSADLANGDTLDFRVLRNGAAFSSYAVTPRITVSKVVPGSFNAFETATAALEITGVIKTKVAGTGFSLDVVAISGGAQQVAFTSPVTVELLGNVATGVSLDTENCPTSFSLQQASNPANPTITGGRSTVSFDAVTNVYRDVRVRVRWPTSTPTVTWCSTDNFAIRPASLTAVEVTDNDWETATPGTTRALNNVAATGGIVHKAGRPFRIAATAQNSAATTTSNYNGSPTAIGVARVLPTVGECGGCTAGSVATGTWSAASGVVTTTDATYSEAGSINMVLEDQTWSSVDNSDGSTTAERYFSSPAFNVGRFVPDHFDVSTSSTPQFQTFGAADSACQAPPSGNKRVFTYVGQSFGYVAVPVATFTGKNAAGGTTLNYAGSLIHTGSISATQTYTPGSGTLSATVGSPGIAAGTAGTGTGTVTINSADSFAYVRSNSAPQAPFNASISLDVSVTDTSENATSQGNITTTTAGTFSAIAFDSGNLIRYGRLRMLNAIGVARAALPVTIWTEYWNGSGFITNTDDHCTTLTRANIALGTYSNSLNACETIVNVNPVTFTSGVGTLGMSASGAGNEGSVNLTPQLGSTFIGKYCTAVGGIGNEADPTPAAKSYLQGAWTGSTYDENPTARAAFGVYGSQPKNFIFFRENY
ncbi:MAG: DUF6701 domain-containing protein [Burkholderiales bacterium]